MDPTLGAGNRPITDHRPIGDANLPRKDHTISKLGPTGDAHLGREGASTTHGHAMANLDKIVDLAAGTNPGFPD